MYFAEVAFVLIINSLLSASNAEDFRLELPHYYQETLRLRRSLDHFLKINPPRVQLSKTVWENDDAKLIGSAYHKLQGGDGASLQYDSKNFKGVFDVGRTSPSTQYSANFEHDSGLSGGTTLTKHSYGDSLRTNVGYKVYESPDKQSSVKLSGFHNAHFGGFERKNDYGLGLEGKIYF